MGFFHGVVIERGAKKKKKERFPNSGRERSLIEREEGVGWHAARGRCARATDPSHVSPHRARVASDFGLWGRGLHHFRFGFLQTHLHTGHPSTQSSVRRVRESWILPLSTLLARGTRAVGTWTLPRRSPAVCAILAQMATYARSPQHCTADGCGMPVSFASLEIISHRLQLWEHLFVHLGLHTTAQDHGNS